MPIDLSDGVTVQVDQLQLPVLQVVPPSSVVTVLPVVGPPGPRGPAGGGSDVGQVRLTAVASANLSGHRAVTPRPDGTLEYASNTHLDHLHVPVWITQGAVAIGGETEVLVYGTLTEPTWSWLPGGAIYLGADGVLTQSVPTTPGALFAVQIGTVTAPTTAFFDRQMPILLV